MARKPTRFEKHEIQEPIPVEQRQNPQRLEYTIPKMEQFIEDRGIDVYWERAYLCPCRTGMTRSPDPLCPICHGRGVGFMYPKVVKMIIQSQDRSVSNTDLGLYDSGTAIGTSMIDSEISFRDRITLPEVEIEQSMLLDITQKHVDLGYHLPYDVKDITFAVIDGGEEVQEGVDYEINIKTNTLYPKEHLKGKNLSINIKTVLRYIIIDLLKESRYQYTNKLKETETFHNLPRKFLLKREDAWVNPTPVDYEGTFDTDPNYDLAEDKEWEDTKRHMNGGFFLGGYS